MKPVAVGVDFGTTNSSLARVEEDGSIALAKFSSSSGWTEAYRSLLYLEQVKEGRASVLKSWSGPEGIERYLDADPKGRLIQSLKSFLASRSLTGSEIFGRRRTLEELIARIVKDLREKSESCLGAPIGRAIVGRPVRFVGSEGSEQDEFALGRLREALRIAGFEAIEFEMEPVAAAYYYESTLDHDELIMIGDFGGGTSDFSLVRVGPSVRKRGRQSEDLLGNAGIGLAGDAFDAKIVRNLVAPALGAGTSLRSLHKKLPVPTWVYGRLERWHHLSFLKSGETIRMLRSVRAQADEPERIAAFLHLIEEDLGYQLHRSVQQTKCALSHNEVATFRFQDGSVDLDCVVTQEQFNSWIQDELIKIEDCVDGLLAGCSVFSSDVDMVFLTGGTSFVPAVRAIFEDRFGRGKIRTGNEFTSVAAGLALKAAETMR